MGGGLKPQITTLIGQIGNGGLSSCYCSSGGGSTGYHYGWPSGGTSEPNVVAQWLFDEASGNIVDEVSGVALIPTGSPTYSQTITGDFASLSPGIRGYGAPTHSYFESAAGRTELAIGANDAVIEFVCIRHAADWCVMFAGELPGHLMQWTDATTFRWYIQTPAGGGDMYWSSIPNHVGDGLPHKYRIVRDTSSNTVELFIDGSTYGTNGLLGTYYIEQHLFSLLGEFSGQYACPTTMLEFRLTIGNKTNNSGGPGGG
jgi:hypothetical protein